MLNNVAPGGNDGTADAGNTPTAGGSPPLKLDARRTLIIGLGSTGTYICNQILEHLEWAYGSPKNLPWLRCLVFETEDVPAEKAVHKHSRVEYLRVKAGSFGSLISNPDAFKDSMDFPDWKNDAVIASHSAIAYGANNTRMLGRIALLFPDNFTRVESAIQKEAQELGEEKLTVAKAQTTFSKAFGRPVSLEMASDIHVYVVGTLCGGTGSGGFLDMGYLLRRLGFPKVTGIFTLPALGEATGAEKNKRWVANAVSALVELNHYSDDRNRYQVLWPGDESGKQSFLPGQTPYHYVYLVQSRNTGGESYRQLMTSVADYVRADLFGPTAGARDGKRVNISSWFNERDQEGATQRFFTFGMSAIEFPVVRVTNACQVRLFHQGLEQMLSGPQDADVVVKARLKQIRRLNRDILVDALATPADASSLFETYGAVITEAERNAAPSSDPARILRDAQEQLDAGFSTSAGLAHPKIPADVVRTTVQTNALTVQEQILTEILNEVESLLVVEEDLRADRPAGLDLARKFVGSVLEALTRKAGDGGDAIGPMENEMAVALRRVEECQSDFLLKFTLQRQNAVTRYVGEWTQAARALYEQRIRVTAAPVADTCRAALVRDVTTLQDRLIDEQVGVLRRARQVLDGLKVFKDSLDSSAEGDKWTRRVNGLELFTAGPGGTIDQEYERCLNDELRRRNVADDPATVERRLARAATRQYFRGVMTHLRKKSTDRTTPYDATHENSASAPGNEELLALSEPAGVYFAGVAARPVIERLMARSDREAKVTQAANPVPLYALEWDESVQRYRTRPQKEYALCSYATEPNNPAFETLLTDQHLAMEQVSILDRHQIFFLREQGAFPLAMIKGLQSPDSAWWQVYLHERDVVHARADIGPTSWTSWHVGTDDYAERLRALFLTAVAMDVCRFEGSARYRFDYPRRSMRDLGYQEFGNDLMDTVNTIRDKNLEGLLLLAVRAKIEDEGAVAAVDKMEECAQTVEQEQGRGGVRFFDGGERVSGADLEGHFHTFVGAHPELQKAFEAKFPNLADSQYITRDANGVAWYYCPHCNVKLGKSSLNLRYYDQNQRKYVRQCQSCKKELA